MDGNMKSSPLPASLQLGVPLLHVPLLHGTEDLAEWESALHRLLKVLDLEFALWNTTALSPSSKPGDAAEWSRKRELANLIIHQSLSYPPVRAALKIHGWNPWEQDPAVTRLFVKEVFEQLLPDHELFLLLRNKRYRRDEPLDEYLAELCHIKNQLGGSVPESTCAGLALDGLAAVFPVATLEWRAQVNACQLSWRELMRQLFRYCERIKRGDIAI
jgi:hypothetical protein